MKFEFLKVHPKGLYLLFFVEMWERFSYYGMRALLVLYVIQYLFKDIELTKSTEYAGNIYGWYTGLVYLTPIIGGYIADRFLGQRKCISIGALLMIIGLLILSASGYEVFYKYKLILFGFGLFFMIIANGFVKSNISTVVGKLYGNDNTRKDSGFTIFYMGINLGAFISPLICGTLAYLYGFQYGFMASGLGILIGYITYKLGEKPLLGDCGLSPYKAVTQGEQAQPDSLNSQEKHRLWALFILMAFSIIFWTCYEQAGSSLALFAENETQRNFLFLGKNLTIPSQYFQSLNPLFIIIFAPLMSIFWNYLNTKNKEPNSIVKFILSLFLISAAYLVMSAASHFAVSELVSPLWLVIVFFVATISELCLSPIGLSLVTKLAPIKFASLIMGCWFLSSFFGNLGAGLLAGNYEKISHTYFFLILSLASLITAILLISISPTLKKWMGEY